MKITKSQLRKIIKEELGRVLNENQYQQLFGRSWGDKFSWGMLTGDSIVQAWTMMGKPDPARFIGDLPHEWQKPKVTKALQDAGADVGGGAGAPDSAPTSGYSRTGPDPSKAKKTAEFEMDPKTGKVTQ